MAAISLRFPDDLEERLDAAAREEGLARSELVRRALDDYLKRRAVEQRRARLAEAARRLMADPEAVAESVEIAEAFAAVEDPGADGPRWWR